MGRKRSGVSEFGENALPITLKLAACLAGPPSCFRCSAKIVKTAGRDGTAHVIHKILVIGEINLGQQHHAEDFSRLASALD